MNDLFILKNDMYLSKAFSQRNCKMKKQNCNGVVIEIYLDHKFQGPQEGRTANFLHAN